MRTIKAFGRTFDTSDNGFLLDQQGNETQFKTVNLQIRHGARDLALFNDAQEGDYTVHTGEFQTSPAWEDPTQDFDIFLLMREGRMVRFMDTQRSTTMID